MDGSIVRSLGRFSFTPHAHKCENPKCGFVWAHDPNDPGHTEQTFNRAHDCPRCGEHVTGVYEGTEQPIVIHDGMHMDVVADELVHYVEEADETREIPHSGLSVQKYRELKRLNPMLAAWVRLMSGY